MIKNNDFYNELAFKESTNNHMKVNKIGYLGLYQMGEAALQDIGYYLGDKTINNDWIGKWSCKFGVYSKDSFLNNQQVQNIAVREYHQIVWIYLKDYYQYEGKEIGGVILSKAGMVACGHLVGHGALKKFINTGGKTDYEDKNHVQCSEYLIYFQSYNINYSIDGLIKELPEDQNCPEFSYLALGVNGAINDKLEYLLSDPIHFMRHQQESLAQGMDDLEEAENIVPGIKDAASESLSQNQKWLQQFIAIDNPEIQLDKIRAVKQQKQEMAGDQDLFSRISIPVEEVQELNDMLGKSMDMVNDLKDDPQMQAYIQNLVGQNNNLFDDEQV